MSVYNTPPCAGQRLWGEMIYLLALRNTDGAMHENEWALRCSRLADQAPNAVWLLQHDRADDQVQVSTWEILSVGTTVGKYAAVQDQCAEVTRKEFYSDACCYTQPNAQRSVGASGFHPVNAPKHRLYEPCRLPAPEERGYRPVLQVLHSERRRGQFPLASVRK